MLGTAVPKYEKVGVFHTASWTRADGTPVFAVWTGMYKRGVSISFEGEVKSVSDYLGKEVSYRASGGKVRLTADGGVVYIEGIRNAKVGK